jgi:hypothetical protein
MAGSITMAETSVTVHLKVRVCVNCPPGTTVEEAQAVLDGLDYSFSTSEEGFEVVDTEITEQSPHSDDLEVDEFP